MMGQTRFPTSARVAQEDTARASCLSDTQILLILDGTLRLDADPQAEDHIDQCDECRALLIALLRTDAITATSGRQRPTS
jgi:hypothetical protein